MLKYLSLFFLAVTSFTSSLGAADKQPNVLFIISDDLNNNLGCYEDPQAKTPNLDKLAARGVQFNNSYCSYPLCGPSRNSLLTGLYPNSTGILANSQIFRQTIPSQWSMPQAFRLSGYFAARVGKLYHYNVPKSIGTNGHDDPASWEIELNPAGVDRLEEEPNIFSLTPGQFGGTLSWFASPKSDKFHTDGLNAQDAQWVLERCAARTDRPFFLALGFFRPHTPYVAPKDPYFGWYPENEMRIVPDIKADQADIPAAGLASYKKEQDALTDDLRRKALQAYYSSISFMDAQVGSVIDTLDRLGLAETTIIVFASDHGYHTGEHGLWQKQSLFEECARVPLLIVAPGVGAKGRIAKSPVSLVDVFPTLAELCGVETPDNLQGQSLVPMLKDPDFVGRGWAITQVVRNAGGGRKQRAAANKDAETDGNRFFGYSLRTPKWRFTLWDDGKRGRELYDHDTDPKELTNLAEKPEFADTVKQLTTQLSAATKTTFPASGKTPELKAGLWAPNLTDP